MKITPKSESELSSFDLLPPGDYPFTVLNSDEIASKSEKNNGKMMFAIKLNVHGPTGDRHVYDYFADWFSEWKLKHFCDTTGQGAAYEKGNVDGTNGAFIGKTGYVTIAIEKGKGSFGDKNVVKDYVPKEGGLVESPAPDDGEDIPF